MVNTKIQLQFIGALLLGTLLLSFFILKPFLSTLILAIIFAVILHPLYKKINKLLGKRESLAAWITLLLGIICIVIPFTLLGIQLLREALQLYTSLSQGENKYNLIYNVVQDVSKFSSGILPGTEDFFVNLSNNIDIYLKQGLIWLINNLGSFLSSISKLTLDLFVFLIALYYLLRDGVKCKQFITKLSPLGDKNDGVIFSRLETAVNSIVKGKIFVAIIQGILTSVGFTIFGIPNSILWGSIAALVSLVPPIGTALVIIPGVIYLFVIGSYIPAFGLFLWGTLIVGLIDNILGPKLIGKDLELNPLLILVSILGGLIFFGPVGIFLGPLVISIFFTLISIYPTITNQNN